MSFDKTKAMRSAERFLSQGKIRAAITEYQKIVDSDPKDFSTLNILGDLFAKGNEKDEAVGCFKQVAEHYSKQGFAQKAIAIYNKISRLDPNLPDVSEKLAQLYQSRGSFAEARSHYTALAEQYQKKGKKAEALEIWKQIAKLDPNNTEVYIKVAEFCLQNGQKDEATKAYTEAGIRLAALDQIESALTAFSRALEIRQYDLAALNGYVKAQIKLGYAEDGARRLEKILEQSPYNREILYLLVDCHLEARNLAAAEEAVIRLVEQEPANYPKFIDLVELYINEGELVAAARVLSMSSEHLLVGGKHDEFFRWANEISARDPEQIDALRLLVRYHGWQRDEKALRDALERLAEIARLSTALDDEKYALSQLVMIVPHEVGYAKRLQEIKIEQGDFSVPEPSAPIVSQTRAPAPDFSSFQTLNEFEPVENRVTPETMAEMNAEPGETFGFEASYSPENGHSNGIEAEFDVEPAITLLECDVTPDRAESKIADFEPVEDPGLANVKELSPSDELRLSQESESIEFYIAQGYRDLADRTISMLESDYGPIPAVVALRTAFEQSGDAVETENMAEAVLASQDPELSAEVAAETPFVEVVPQPMFGANGTGDFLDEFRAEFGLEETGPAVDDDFDTVFHTAVAYKEMGLLEDSIRGFQDAVNRVRPDDGTRRFFQSCILLGHCFMDKGMPNLALMWYKRSQETPELTHDENQAMLYEIGNAYAVAGDQMKAVEYFEQIYALDVDYRDVSGRLAALQVSNHA